VGRQIKKRLSIGARTAFVPVGCEGFEPLSRLSDFTGVSRGQLKIQAFI